MVLSLGAGLIGALTLVVPSTASTGQRERPVVVATTSIWADVVDQLDCTDRLQVTTLVPPGADPHGYEPSMQDRDRLDGAALVVANGAGLEAILADTLDSVAAGGVPVVRVTDHVTTYTTGDGEVDPHVWLDPTLVAEALPTLAAALAAAVTAAGGDTGALATLEHCRDDLTTSLQELDAELAGLAGALPAERRVLVTNHDALGYLARRYGFTILGTVLPSTSTLAEASPGELDELAATIEETGVPTIFTGVAENADGAAALADRLGVNVVELPIDSLGGPGSDADTYQAMMRHAVQSIVAALG